MTMDTRAQEQSQVTGVKAPEKVLIPQAEIPPREAMRSMPVYERRRDILEVIGENEVTIIEGQTGSGKSVVMPILLMEQFGESRIAVSQPRKEAARNLARYVASVHDTTQKVGDDVGYQVRGEKRTSEKTRLTYMTDGILLALLSGDLLLSEYDIVVVDEAHERSLNIDFCLGLLKNAQKKREGTDTPLKLVITSATLDQQKMSDYFAKEGKETPSLAVEGRMFPVTTSYESVTPLDDMLYYIARGKVEIALKKYEGNILIFMPGKREIEAMAEELESLVEERDDVEIISLYAGQEEEQRRVYDNNGKRKIIIATNIAETSLTIPNARVVIDSGYIKQVEYDAKTGVESIRRVWHSQDGVNQRTGRVGRTSGGHCFRLYSEEIYKLFPEHTKPEIMRSDLSSVVLTMKKMGIQNVHDFDFIDKPRSSDYDDTLRTLTHLGALDEKGNITALGERMADIPVEPHLARMLISAEHYGCVDEVVTVAAMLSVPDVFAMPKGKKEEARTAHAVFKDYRSDYITMLNVWHSYQDNRDDKGWAKEHFLKIRSLIEIGQVRAQIFQVLQGQNMRISFSGNTDDLGMCITSGLLDKVFVKADGKYHHHFELGASSLFGTPRSAFISSSSSAYNPVREDSREEEQYIPDVFACKSLFAAETGRLYAGGVQRVKLSWLVKLAPHLLTVKKIGESRLDPFEDVKRQRVEVSDKAGRILGTYEQIEKGGIGVGERREALVDSIVDGSIAIKGCEVAYDTYFEKRRALLALYGEELSVPTFEEVIKKEMGNRHFRRVIDVEMAFLDKSLVLPTDPEKYVNAELLSEIKMKRPAYMEVNGSEYALSYNQKVMGEIVPTITLGHGESIFSLPGNLSLPNGNKVYVEAYGYFVTSTCTIEEAQEKELPLFLDKEKRKYCESVPLARIDGINIDTIALDDVYVEEVSYTKNPMTGEDVFAYFTYALERSAYDGTIDYVIEKAFDTEDEAERRAQEVKDEIEKVLRKRNAQKSGVKKHVPLQGAKAVSKGDMIDQLKALQALQQKFGK